MSLFKTPRRSKGKQPAEAGRLRKEEAGQIGLQDAPEDGQGISPRVGGGDPERPQSNATGGRPLPDDGPDTSDGDSAQSEDSSGS